MFLQAKSSYSQSEDHILFLLMKKRDKEAFTVVYRKYHAYLYALAVRYLKDTEMAEDAVQHVFVKLWENAKMIDVQINLKNYLFTMTKNHILNQIRNRKEVISVYYANAQNEIPDGGEFLTLLEEIELSEQLYKAIENLPPRKKEVCKLKMNGNISNKEIAQRMGVSVNTVKSHYQESIKMLRKYFQNIKLMLF